MKINRAKNKKPLDLYIIQIKMFMKRISLIVWVSFILFLISSFSWGDKDDEKNTQLNAEEIKEMLDAHNFYRNELGIDSLEWSDDLAKEAQAWADKLAAKGCRFYHSKTKNGENIYWSSYESTPKEAVDSWGSEKEFYRGGKIESGKVAKYGHYTQMIWEKTTHVGGGKAICKNGSTIYVCQYSPPGNFIGEYPYQKKKRNKNR